MTVSFRTKLLASHLSVALLAGGAAALLIESSLAARLEERADRRLEGQASAVAHWLEGAKAKHLDQLATRLSEVVGARVTFVDRFGIALGDSAERSSGRPGMDPEGSRGEVDAARAGRVGRASRYSVDVGEEMRYVAVAAPRDLVVRLGVPTAEIHEASALVRGPLLAGTGASLAVAILLAAVLARALSRRVRDLRLTAERIGRGEHDDLPLPRAEDEIGVLGRTLALAGRKLGEHEARRREFLANVAHELRTPVTSIQGYAETLRGEDADAATRQEFIGIIHRNAVRISKLVDDLLQLEALAERPPAREAVGRIEIAAAVRHVLETASPLADEGGAALSADVPPGLSATADPDALEQVLLNLVDNAIRNGGPGVSVQIEGSVQRQRARLRVRDDGPGIAAEHLPHIFDRFYRAHPAAGRAGGLGLAIARELVESMNGSIDVESTPGEGTSFTVELPA